MEAAVSRASEIRQVSANVWQTFLDSYGRTLDEYSIRKWTFYKGMSPCIRAESWKYLLGYYPFSSTKSERQSIDREKREQYEKLSQQLKDTALSDINSIDSFSEFSKYLRVIEKDSLRTDRHISHFEGKEGNENIEALKRVLGAFVLYDPQLGYVQGMNELLSPLMVVLQSEHQSFWCLVNVLQRMRSKFSDLTLSQPLCDMARLCLYADSQLHNHIDHLYEGEDWLFCYRGLLLNFKREFSFEDILSLWETIWCNHSTTHYELFVAVAILVHYKSQIMQCSTVESLMEFSMKVSGQVPLEPVQKIARSLLEQIKADEYCPYELRHLIARDGCAPPPLVGFVRTRQRLATLHSSRIKYQRDEVWQMLFGGAPVKAVTTPFMLSLGVTTDSSPVLTHRSENQKRDEQSGDHTVAVHSQANMPNQKTSTEPPKAGFVPRTQDHGISHREAIRKAPTSPYIIASSQCAPTMNLTSRIYKQETNTAFCSVTEPTYRTPLHAYNTSVCNNFRPSDRMTINDGPLAHVLTSSHLDTYGVGCGQAKEVESCTSNFVQRNSYNNVSRPDVNDSQLSTDYSVSSSSEIAFDILRSEPQLITS